MQNQTGYMYEMLDLENGSSVNSKTILMPLTRGVNPYVKLKLKPTGKMQWKETM